MRPIDELRAATLSALIALIDDVGFSDGLQNLDSQQPSALQLFEALEMKGLVSRAAPRPDEKGSEILITDSGRELLKRARDHQKAVLAAAVERIPEARLGEVLAALERFAAQRAGSDDSASPERMLP